MLQPLTKYLFQYRTVSIPQVGTIKIIQQSARLDVVGKCITPPAFFAELENKDEVTEHQLNFLENFLGRTNEDVVRDLKFFGAALHEKINGSGFEWKGLGTINRSTQKLPVRLQSIQPVTAEKITRADAKHQILVGDQQMTSVQMTERKTNLEIVKKKRSWSVIAGWILFLLSIVILVFLLYTGKFTVNAIGSKQKVAGYQHINNPNLL